MAISLAGTGSLPVRWGKIIKGIAMMRGAAGFTNPDPGSAWGSGGPTIVAADDIFDAIQDQYEATSQDLIAGLYAAQRSYQQALSGQFSYFAGLANDTLIRMAHDDTPLPSLTTELAMALLIKQMIANSNTIKSNVTAVTAAAVAGNIGNPKFVATVTGPNGKLREYIIPEIIHAKATTDKNNGATAGRETFTFSSPFSITDPMDRLWPGGSGASGSMPMCDNTVDADSSIGGNILTNSDMETFAVANLPDNWVKLIGTTSILKNTSIKHRGTNSLTFTGDAAELTAITQEFDAVAGTTVALLPMTLYCFSMWVYVDVDPVAGVLAISLVDGSDVVVNNDAAVANTITSSIPDIGPAAWVQLTGFFRTPTNIPDTLKLRIKLTTALSAGSILYLDDISMCQGTEIYVGGPYAAMFHGLTDVLINDDFTATTTNDYGGAFQTWADRFFNMRAGLQMQIPSATGGGHSIADTLCF